MKLRINGNSVRIRVNQLEFEAFEEYGSIADILELPGGPISYALEKCEEDTLNVSRLGDSIRIGIPKEMAEKWRSEAAVGFNHIQKTGDKEIEIIVEKELKCPTPENCKADEDAFPRPKEESFG
ncbi:MAG: hypothetical protein R3275_02200 [Saprospiraceae bacterium]|nr:hypothetical protein [Saprospiraceae bacterium]